MHRKKKAGAKDRRMQNSRAPARRGSHAAEREAAAAAQADVGGEKATEGVPPQEVGDAETSNEPINDDTPLQKRLGKPPVWGAYAILDSPTPNNASSFSAQLANTAAAPTTNTNNPLSRTPLDLLTQQYELMQNTIFSRDMTISALHSNVEKKDEELAILHTQVTQLSEVLKGANGEVERLRAEHRMEVEMVKKVAREAIEHVRGEEVVGLEERVRVLQVEVGALKEKAGAVRESARDLRAAHGVIGMAIERLVGVGEEDGEDDWGEKAAGEGQKGGGEDVWG